MGQKSIIVNTPNKKNHSDAQDWAAVFNGLYGGNTGILPIGSKLVVGVNEEFVIINDGVFSLDGHMLRVKDGTKQFLKLPETEVGKKRIAYVVAQYVVNTKLEDDTLEFAILAGEEDAINPLPPQVTTGNIDRGDRLNQAIIAELLIDGNKAQVNRYGKKAVILPSVAYDKEFKTHWKYVNNKMSTKEIQDVINTNKNVVFTKGKYIVDLWYNGADWNIGFELKSNSNIIFEDGAELELPKHDLKGYDILRCYNVENVRIENAIVNGRRDLNESTEHGEWGAGIGLRGSKNITIDRCTLKNCWGDGIYVGHSNQGKKPSENIIVQNTVCDNNRRQGISVISVDGLGIYDTILSNTNGIAPEAGIDFEGNFHEVREEVFKNIRLDNIKTLNNNGAGIMGFFTGISEKGLEEPVQIEINNFHSKGDAKGLVMNNLNNTKNTGYIKLNGALIKDCKYAGITFESVSKDSVATIINNVTIVNPFKDQKTQEYETHAVNFLRFALAKSKYPNYYIGNIDINNLKVSVEGSQTYPAGDVNFYDGGRGVYGVNLINVSHKIKNHLNLVDSKVLEKHDWEASGGTLPKENELYNCFWLKSGNSIKLPNATDLMNSIEYTFYIQNYTSGGTVTIKPTSSFFVPYQDGKNGVVAKDKDFTGWSITFKIINKKWVIIQKSGDWQSL